MKTVQTVTTSLWEFWDRYKSGKLRLPSHQGARGNVWASATKKEWWEDIKRLSDNGGGMVGGMITTYYLVGQSNTILYLNDGANRCIHTIAEFISQCEQSDINWKDILMRCKITEQVNEYENVTEAIKQFWKLNLGTISTPYEMVYALFVEQMDNFEDVWKPLLTKVHNTIDNTLIRLGCKIPSLENIKQRPIVHKKRRDNMNLFYKFLSKDDTRWSPKVATSQLNCNNWDEQTKLENRLIQILVSMGSDEAKKHINNFEKFIGEHCAFYKQMWQESHIPFGYVPSNTHFRWWLLVALYRKNNNFPWEKFKEFTKKLIQTTHGRSIVLYTDKKGIIKNTNLAMSNLSNITTILKSLKVIDFEYRENRDKVNSMLFPGLVNSHLLAYSSHGNGDTIVENAIDNNKRLNRDMTNNEIDNLKSL